MNDQYRNGMEMRVFTCDVSHNDAASVLEAILDISDHLGLDVTLCSDSTYEH